MLRKLALSTLLLASFSVSAVNVSVNTEISSIAIFSHGGIAINTTNAVQQGCYENDTRVKAYVGQNNMTEEGVARILSVALTAKATGSTVKITFDNVDANCFVSSIQMF